MAIVVKTPSANAEDVGGTGLIPGWGRSSGEGHGDPLQYACQETLMDRGAWLATVQGVAKCQTRLSDFHFISLEGLIVFIEPFNFSFFSITSWGIDLDYCDIEWFALGINRDHSVIFEIASKYSILDSFLDYDGYSISSKGFLHTVVDTSKLNSPIPVHFSLPIPKMSMFTLDICCLTTSNLP